MRKINNITIAVALLLLFSVTLNFVLIYHYINEKIILCSSSIADWATAIIALSGFLVAFFKLRKSNKIAESTFWVKLRDSFRKHNKVHRKLEEKGKWRKKSKKLPKGNKDWVSVYAYLGQLELCNKMIDNGLIDLETFKTQYKYRIENILSNERIVQKIIDDKEYWKEFIRLTKKMKDLYNPLQSIEFEK